MGDDDLHLKLTKQDSSLIHENIEKLLDSGATIKFRMVMVPGFNDGESNIQATSEFLKSIGYDSIEVLKYHNLYEEKAKRLGLDVAPLNITPEQSLASVMKGIELFKQHGIDAECTGLDSNTHPAVFTQRVQDIQKAIRESGRALCIEAAKLKTKYYKQDRGRNFKKPTPIHRAERLRYVLQNKKVIIYPQELLVGNYTSKRAAGQLWEELYGDLSSIFLYKVNRQKPVPFKCSRADISYCYTHIFPFWRTHRLFHKVYPTLSKFVMGVTHAAEMVAGFENNSASIAHFIANFPRLLPAGNIRHHRGNQGEEGGKAREQPGLLPTGPSFASRAWKRSPSGMPIACRP